MDSCSKNLMSALAVLLYGNGCTTESNVADIQRPINAGVLQVTLPVLNKLFELPNCWH